MTDEFRQMQDQTRFAMSLGDFGPISQFIADVGVAKSSLLHGPDLARPELALLWYCTNLGAAEDPDYNRACRLVKGEKLR